VPADRVATDMLSLLDIEELDTNLYRGYNEHRAAERPALFGGQVAARALMAAARTVPEPRLPHSLHGYFLRPGSPDHPVILQVARDRDGRSFSARHVVALQGGEVIFSMSASFHHGEDGPEFSLERQRLTTSPEDVAERRDQMRFEQMLRIRPFPRCGRTATTSFPYRPACGLGSPGRSLTTPTSTPAPSRTSPTWGPASRMAPCLMRPVGGRASTMPVGRHAEPGDPVPAPAGALTSARVQLSPGSLLP
jgi:hypothetical protein